MRAAFPCIAIVAAFLAACGSSEDVSPDGNANADAGTNGNGDASGNGNANGADAGAGAAAPADAAAGGDAAADAAAAADASPLPPPATRLRVTNHCARAIWLAHSDNVPAPQNVMLAQGASYDVPIPDGALASTRFWPKFGCDATGASCSMGDDGEGGGKPCPASGCEPPLDSKLEVTFAASGATDSTWYNLSQVDGYTLPFKVRPFGTKVEQGSCVTSDCGKLDVSACPSAETIGGGTYDLRVRDQGGAVIACMSPCKKVSYPAPWGLGEPEGTDPGLHMCCPTPVDPSTGNCTEANGCMTAQACRDASDPLSVVHTSYVAAIHAMCPSAYSYSYDDGAGLHTCPSDTRFELTFCP